ncbi:MAG: hypothetical protein PHF56_12360 [Desulfuromonadaceae bacterium]|nr:hypothetical protein [Desulfuromonadaceae bacterium]
MRKVKRSTQVSGWLYIFIIVAILSASYVTFAASSSGTSSSSNTTLQLGFNNMSGNMSGTHR